MKKLLLILLCLPIIVLAQQTYVPDDNFEAYLEGNVWGDGLMNDYVPTSAINYLTQIDIDGLNIADLTGIQDFSALDYFSCRNNYLTSINISSNLSLTVLHCSDNPLTSLDVSNNIALEEILCENNQLTSLDISNNTALRSLYCNNNQITNLDISNNTDLGKLLCDNNQLTCIDISSHPNLGELDCKNNNLEQLIISNGYWWLLEIYATNNNLTCIEVDDVAYANSNWTNYFDNSVTFSTNCNYTNPCATVSAIQEHTTNKELLKVTDLLGRETKGTKNEVLFYIYDDGTVEKRIVIE